MSSRLQRLISYQKERFPLVVHIPLIAAFSFSAISYSQSCRGAHNSLEIRDYISCIFTNLVVFFALRVSDEHKDHEDDRLYRQYLPVIRGLISLKELRFVALILLLPAILINIIFYPKLFSLFSFVLVYLSLMRYEFFVGHWLKKRQMLYNASHMLIIPIVDMYASAYDWKIQHDRAPTGLLFFFMVSFLNGFVLEIGRKIRVADKEEFGVISYTKLWGTKNAVIIWLCIMAGNFLLACMAAWYAQLNTLTFVILGSLLLVCSIPGYLFLNKQSTRNTKLIELVSLIWAIGMYMSLGALPALTR